MELFPLAFTRTFQFFNVSLQQDKSWKAIKFALIADEYKYT